MICSNKKYKLQKNNSLVFYFLFQDCSIRRAGQPIRNLEKLILYEISSNLIRLII